MTLYNQNQNRRVQEQTPKRGGQKNILKSSLSAFANA